MVVQIKSPTMACFSSIGFHALACPVGLGQLTSEADRKGVASAIETAIAARLQHEPQKALTPLVPSSFPPVLPLCCPSLNRPPPLQASLCHQVRPVSPCEPPFSLTSGFCRTKTSKDFA